MTLADILFGALDVADRVARFNDQPDKTKALLFIGLVWCLAVVTYVAMRLLSQGRRSR